MSKLVRPLFLITAFTKTLNGFLVYLVRETKQLSSWTWSLNLKWEWVWQPRVRSKRTSIFASLLAAKTRGVFSGKMLSEATNHDGKNRAKTENSRRWGSRNIFIWTETLIGRISARCRLRPGITLATESQQVLNSLPNGLNLNKHPPFPFHTEMKLLCYIQLKKRRKERKDLLSVSLFPEGL